MSSAAIFVLFLFVAVGSGLLLYLVVRAEHDQRQPMDRETAEQVARRDLPDDASRDDGSRDDAGWGDAARSDAGRTDEREENRFG